MQALHRLLLPSLLPGVLARWIPQSESYTGFKLHVWRHALPITLIERDPMPLRHL